MNVFAKFDEIPSMILQDIIETKSYGQPVGRTDGQTVGQRENSIPSNKHSLRGVSIPPWFQLWRFNRQGYIENL